MLLLHLPLAAGLLALRTATVPVFGLFFAGGANSAPAEADIEEQTLLFVNGHEFPIANTPLIRAVEGRPTPGRIALLGPMWEDLPVKREDDHTLLLTPPSGFLAAPMDRLERRLDVPFNMGERSWMPDFDAEVRTLTADGRPAQVAFHFREPLESPRYRWLTWSPTGATAFVLPAVGETVIVPAQQVSALFPAPANPDGQPMDAGIRGPGSAD